MENNDIIVKEVSIEEAVKVNRNVIEFDGKDTTKEDFEKRYVGKDNLIIVAYYKNIPIGYIIGYDRDNDGSFYCWMAGVDNNYRRLGALTSLMNYQMDWAKKKGYNKLKIRTRNNRREMLSFLVKNGFNFVSVEQRDDITENRINLEHSLIKRSE